MSEFSALDFMKVAAGEKEEKKEKMSLGKKVALGLGAAGVVGAGGLAANKLRTGNVGKHVRHGLKAAKGLTLRGKAENVSNALGNAWREGEAFSRKKSKLVLPGFKNARKAIVAKSKKD